MVHVPRIGLGYAGGIGKNRTIILRQLGIKEINVFAYKFNEFNLILPTARPLVSFAHLISGIICLTIYLFRIIKIRVRNICERINYP